MPESSRIFESRAESTISTTYNSLFVWNPFGYQKPTLYWKYIKHAQKYTLHNFEMAEIYNFLSFRPGETP